MKLAEQVLSIIEDGVSAPTGGVSDLGVIPNGPLTKKKKKMLVTGNPTNEDHTWNEWKDIYSNHQKEHCLHLVCPSCDKQVTCRCTAPKDVIKSLCDDCRNK